MWRAPYSRDAFGPATERTPARRREPARLPPCAAHPSMLNPSRMPPLVLPLAEIAPRLPHRGVLVGLDLGTKTIGVAISDADPRPGGGLATSFRQGLLA